MIFTIVSKLSADLLDDIHMLDLTVLQWTKLLPGVVYGVPPSPRIFAGVAGDERWGSKIYVFGGNTDRLDSGYR